MINILMQMYILYRLIQIKFIFPFLNRLSLLINHEIYHRSQLTVIMRQVAFL